LSSHSISTPGLFFWNSANSSLKSASWSAMFQVRIDSFLFDCALK